MYDHQRKYKLDQMDFIRKVIDWSIRNVLTSSPAHIIVPSGSFINNGTDEYSASYPRLAQIVHFLRMVSMRCSVFMLNIVIRYLHIPTMLISALSYHGFVFFMYRYCLFSSYPRSAIVIILNPLSYRYFISASNRFKVVSIGLLLSLKSR